jgi:hypothetical protein
MTKETYHITNDLSFYADNEYEKVDAPHVSWIEARQDEISITLNEIDLSQGKFLTPEIQIAAQKLTEATFWLQNSNCAYDSMEHLAKKIFGYEGKGKLEKDQGEE